MAFTDAAGIHQLDALTAAVQEMARRSNGWDWRTSIPTFLGAVLGFCFALVLDYIRNRNARKKEDRVRRENELAAIAATIGRLSFNLTATIHAVAQQVVPHYEAARSCASKTL